MNNIAFIKSLTDFLGQPAPTPAAEAVPQYQGNQGPQTGVSDLPAIMPQSYQAPAGAYQPNFGGQEQQAPPPIARRDYSDPLANLITLGGHQLADAPTPATAAAPTTPPTIGSYTAPRFSSAPQGMFGQSVPGPTAPFTSPQPAPVADVGPQPYAGNAGVQTDTAGNPVEDVPPGYVGGKAPPSLPQVGGPLSPEERYNETTDTTRYQPPIYQLKDSTGKVVGTTSSEKKKDKWLATSGNQVEQTQQAGAGRNKKWSTWEKIGSALMGWAQGGLLGGIEAGRNRNYFNEARDARTRAELLPQIAARQAMRKGNADLLKTAGDIKATAQNAASLQTSREATTAHQKVEEKIANERLHNEWAALKQKPIDERAAGILSMYNDAKVWNKKNNPEQKAISEAYMATRGISLPDKDETPQTPVGGTDIDEKTLYPMFGLPDDKTIDSQAAASVAKGSEKIDWNPKMIDALPHDLKNPPTPDNPTGFNMEKFNEAKSNELSPYHHYVASMDVKDLMTKVPDDYDQRKSAEIAKLRKGQQGLAGEVATFQAALKTHRPPANAAKVSLVEAVGLLKEIMANPKKDEREKLKAKFYNEYLPTHQFQ